MSSTPPAPTQQPVTSSVSPEGDQSPPRSRSHHSSPDSTSKTKPPDRLAREAGSISSAGNGARGVKAAVGLASGATVGEGGATRGAPPQAVASANTVTARAASGRRGTNVPPPPIKPAC